MTRILTTALVALLVGGCTVDDPPPPGPPSPSPFPQPQPRPGPVDAGDTDPPFPGDDGGAGEPDAADLSCGDFGAACCTDGPPCAADFTHCDPELGVCAACGDTAGPCCNNGDGPACQPGLSCTAGVCGP